MKLSLSQIETALSTYQPKQLQRETGLWAGVATVLAPEPNGELSVLLIQRSENPSDPWSGHMAMPGGRKDPGDTSTKDAALRETMEEVGIDLATNGRYLGPLDEVEAVARGRDIGLTIAPHVFALETTCKPIPNHEVQDALWVPLHDLQSDEYRSTLPYDMGTTRLMLPCWRWHGKVIWGLTYRMLETLLRVINDPQAD